ncbi:MAG: serine protease [Verrucomicrobium sp.]
MDEDLEDMLRRAEAAFGHRTPAEAIPKTRAIVGPWNIPNSQEAAATAMKKLKIGAVPSANELIALEYVIRVMRPAPLLTNGVPDTIDIPGEILHTAEIKERWQRFRDNAAALTRAVGRIDHPHPSIGHAGTGFLVQEGVLATNNHVLQILSGGTGLIPADAGIKVYFNMEYTTPDPADTIARVLGVVAKHPTQDIVLLEVEKHRGRPILGLDVKTAMEPGHPVTVVGYPAKPNGHNPLFTDGIFGGKYGVKRAAMGEVIRTNKQALIYHDCSTLGGNSGSPVLSLESHGVVGIHSSGAFIYKNEAVRAQEIATLV